jgi:hypothetical protein
MAKHSGGHDPKQAGGMGFLYFILLAIILGLIIAHARHH